jgi:hypothetical protein
MPSDQTKVLAAERPSRRHSGFRVLERGIDDWDMNGRALNHMGNHQ